MSKIFHITTKTEWNIAKSAGHYSPASIKEVGFIHCSKADQVLNVANSFYQGQKDLLIIRINTSKLNSELKIEPPLEAPMSNILFPHIYGSLNMDAVDKQFDFHCASDGKFVLPDLLS